MSEEKNPSSRSEQSKQPEPISESGDIPHENTPATDDERDKKIRDLTASMEELKRQADVYRDQLLRKAAEFENYKRRSEGDLANFVRMANESLISALLPIVNDFVRSLALGKESDASDGFYKGVELIHAKFLRVLEQQGLSTFESVGKPFDVQYHDALFMVPRSDVPPHTIVEEVEKGYKLHDKVLRHAKVIVSTSPDAPPEAVQGSDEERLESD